MILFRSRYLLFSVLFLATFSSFPALNELYKACESNNIQRVQELLQDENINVNEFFCSSLTSLMIACEKGHIKIVKTLLKHKDVLVNQSDRNGNTALFIACYYGYVEVVKNLIMHPNIDVNVKNIYDQTPLHIACLNQQKNVVKLLLSHKKINVNIVDDEKKSALHFAYEHKHIPIVKELLQFGANPKLASLASLKLNNKLKNIYHLYSSLHNDIYKEEKDSLFTQVALEAYYDWKFNNKKDLLKGLLETLPLRLKLQRLFKEKTFNNVTKKETLKQ